MNIKSHQEYILTINDRSFGPGSFGGIAEILNLSLADDKGKILFSANGGRRPWWHRFIFGLKIYVRPYFAVEWSGDVTGLVFYDDNASEFRCLASEVQEVPEKVRKEISFGEESPLENKYCLSKENAVKAIIQFLDKGDKPGWIGYEFVE